MERRNRKRAKEKRSSCRWRRASFLSYVLKRTMVSLSTSFDSPSQATPTQTNSLFGPQRRRKELLPPVYQPLGQQVGPATVFLLTSELPMSELVLWPSELIHATAFTIGTPTLVQVRQLTEQDRAPCRGGGGDDGSCGSSSSISNCTKEELLTPRWEL